MGPIVDGSSEPYAAIGGEMAVAETAKGSRVRVWVGRSTDPVNSQYFCHGEALRTFQLYKYTVFSGADLDKVLQDEYTSVGTGKMQREDILAWMGPPAVGEWISSLTEGKAKSGFHEFVRCHTARVITPFVVHGAVDEAHTLVRTKNGQRLGPTNASLESVVNVYGHGYMVFRWNKKQD